MNCVISEFCHTPLFCCHNSYGIGNCGTNMRVYDEMPQFGILRVGFAWGIMKQARATIQHNSARSTSKGVRS